MKEIEWGNKLLRKLPPTLRDQQPLPHLHKRPAEGSRRPLKPLMQLQTLLVRHNRLLPRRP